MPKWKILCIILAATAFLLLLVAIGTSFDLKDREDHAFAENMQILTSQLKNGSRDKFARIYIYIDTSLSIDEQKSRDLDREKNDVINSIIPVASVNDELHVYTFDSDRIQVCPPLPNQALSATEGQQLPTLTPVDRHQLESEIESGEVPRARIRMLQPLLKAAVEVTNKCKVQVAGIEWRPAHCHGGHDPQCFTDISLLAFNIGRDLQESSG